MYDKASPGYRGRCTAPLLLDKKTRRIISSESPEILATLFRLQLPGSTDFDLAPPHLDQEANQLKALVYNQASIPLECPGFRVPGMLRRPRIPPGILENALLWDGTADARASLPGQGCCDSRAHAWLVQGCCMTSYLS